MLSAIYGKNGFMIDDEEFKNIVKNKYKSYINKLCITEIPQPGMPNILSKITRKAYKIEVYENKKYLIIPKIKGLDLLNIKSNNGSPLIKNITQSNFNMQLQVPRKIHESKFETKETFYSYQSAAINYLSNGILKERGVAYLKMDTGLGKTRVGCGIVEQFKEPTLIVVPTEAIAEQWIDEFSECYPNIVSVIYHNIPKASKKKAPTPLSHDVIVIIINTFRMKTSDFMEGFGIVIIDEVHECHSLCNSKIFWLCQTNVVLGLSATPAERPDGLDKFVNLHLGEVIDSNNIPGFDIKNVSFKGEVRAIKYYGNPNFTENITTPSGTISAILTINHLIMDPSRTELIACEVKRLYNLHESVDKEKLGLGELNGKIRRHGIFIFAELREMLPILKKAILSKINDNVYIPEIDEHPDNQIDCQFDNQIDNQIDNQNDNQNDNISMLRGGVDRKAVVKARTSQIVLTTYGFSRRGISLPDMTALVLTTPRKGSLQVIGRILRRGSDESIVRQIVDIIDMRTGLKNQFNDRKKKYKLKGYPINFVEANYENYLL